MRAWSTLRALAEHHEVHLIVAGRASAAEFSSVPLPVADSMLLRRTRMAAGRSLLQRLIRRGAPWFASRVMDPPEWTRCDACARVAIANFVDRKQIGVQHVFRLYSMPVADVVRDIIPDIATQLDLDDLEFGTRTSFASLHEQRANPGAARRSRREARFYRTATANALSIVDVVWVCSEIDRSRLSERFGASRIAVVPNSVPRPRPSVDPACRSPGPFTFLFVGNLGYLPNRDGVEWLAGEVLPRLHTLTAQPFRVQIVGRRPRSRPLRVRESSKDVELVGFVEDLAGFYAGAGAVVVPIRAGGGTRIKAIEAFAQGRPVVTTSVGVEGLDVSDGVHALIADDPSAFAAHCRRMMEEPALRARLASNARELYERCYSPSDVARAVGRVMSPPLRDPGA